MKTRTVAIALGVALAVSVGVNLFAATAAYSVLSSQGREAHQRGDSGRPSSRALIASLSPEARQPVRQALRNAAQRARPEFQASREARRQAIAAAAAEPMDATRVAALLEQSRAAEARGRQSLETDAVAILSTLSPADRVMLSQILNDRGRGRGGRDRSRDDGEPATTPAA